MDETSLSLLDRLKTENDSETWNRLHQLYAPLLRSWLGKYDIQPSDNKLPIPMDDLDSIDFGVTLSGKLGIPLKIVEPGAPARSCAFILTVNTYSTAP
jgi:hypothetical protein